MRAVVLGLLIASAVAPTAGAAGFGESAEGRALEVVPATMRRYRDRLW